MTALPDSGSPAVGRVELRAERQRDTEIVACLLESARTMGVEARFVVAGHSMFPLIRGGDAVQVRPAGSGEPRVGDVAAVRRAPGNGFVVHRVVARKPDGVVVRGDNVAGSDGVFADDAVLGVVARVERGGRPVWFGAGRWGRVVALVVRAGLVRRCNQAVYPVYKLVLRRRGTDRGSPE